MEKGAFADWLIEQGFVETERSDERVKLYRNPQKTLLGEIGEIEISVGLNGQHVELAYVRFLITCDLSNRLVDWQLLADAMGETFGFRLMNESNVLGACGELGAQIREHLNVLELGCGWGFLDKLEQK
ncbi:MAG TPA: hypothetical protein DCY13_22070 [Verrucomicrobiales bacterium]|nr:hypothetical protein [Verrucomicrobiales bacterium]